VRVEEVGRGPAGPLAAAMAEEGDLVGPRLARGCRCFAARRGPEVLAYGWLSSGPEWIGEVELEVRPGPGEAYVWNCVTLPGHRRRGHFRGLLLHVVATACRERLVRLWIGSLEGGAEAALAGAGFEPVLRIAVRRLPGLRWLTVRPAPGADPALVAAAMLALGEGRRRPRGGPRRPRRRRH
jgi:hypothetical protein